MAGEKGASTWLTNLPLKEFNFCLHKRAFFDALALRYGWLPSSLPTKCVCGASFTVEHSLSCPKGGFTSIRHNEIRNFTAKLLTEVCNDVEVEPQLQPLTGKEFPGAAGTNTNAGARLDIAMNGFWSSRYERTFVDVRVFNPHAPSYKSITIDNCYKRHEREKQRSYERRILEVEHSTFTPLVFSVTGGMSKECSKFYKRLASMLADKWNQSYTETLTYLRCCLSDTLLRSSIQSIRGSRSTYHHPVQVPVDLMQSESRLLVNS